MAILITGGAGFIGSHTVDKMLERGEEVIIADDFNDYYSPLQKEKNLEGALKNANCSVSKVDITCFKELESIFRHKRIEKIIHLAARAGVRASIDNPQPYSNVNITGTINLLELAKKYKAKSFVFASSSSVYGNNINPPFSEKVALNPISPYAVTKQTGESLCYVYHHLYGINICCLRFFTVYGPRGRPDMAPYKFTDAIHKGKSIPIFGNLYSKRDYTYVSDVVNGIVAATDSEFPFEIFNIGNSKPIALKKLIETIENTLDKKAKFVYLPKQPGDVEITHADISKAKKLLGYHPKITLKQGKKQFVDWYINERAKKEDKYSI